MIDTAPLPVSVLSAAVEGRGVAVRYGAHTALHRSDFAFAAGTVTVLMGPNGAGKSTLLHAVAGLVPAEGDLRVLGRPPPQARRHVAYVRQSADINARMPVTVAEAVTMGRYVHTGLLGRLRPRDREVVAAVLERLGIAGLARRHLCELSGGQRQRALLAQGLAQEAQVLLLDEPLTGLDAACRELILAVVAEERAAGTTVVVATHDPRDARLADQVLLLDGRCHDRSAQEGGTSRSRRTSSATP